MKAMRGILLGVVLVVATIIGTGSTAHASCAGPPEPSPYAFEGTVIATEDDGRTAAVITADGTEVIVRGGSPDAMSSVDRRYAVGALYEFHPNNDASPYEDNACTATERIWGPRPAPLERGRDRLPGWLPVDEDAGPVGYAPLIGTVLVVAALGFGVVRWRRRHS